MTCNDTTNCAASSWTMEDGGTTTAGTLTSMHKAEGALFLLGNTWYNPRWVEMKI